MPMLATGALFLALGAASLLEPLSEAERASAQKRIDDMRQNPRGPYAGVSWFCADGTMQPPRPYACRDRGGGRQHGVLSRDARRLIDLGIHVGTVLAAVPNEEWNAADYYRMRAYLVEAYLERALDGWVLQSAKSYRGFRQLEDEKAAARLLLIALCKDWALLTQHRVLTLRALRTMPYGRTGSLADEIRALAARIGDADRRFADLRFKIHAMPEPSDIERVEAYADTQSGERATWAQTLATQMRAYYDPQARIERLKQVRNWTHHRPTRALIDQFVAIPASDAYGLVRLGTQLIETAAGAVRRTSTDLGGERNLLLLHTMALVEELWLGVTAPLVKQSMSRMQALQLLDHFLRAAGALGWLSTAELIQARWGITRAEKGTAEAYADGLRELDRVLGWARARFYRAVGVPLRRYQAVEPRAVNVIDDVLRSSVMLPLAALLDRLHTDLEKLRGGGHRLVGFGGVTSVGLRGQNAGLATGPLRVLGPGEDPKVLKREQIVLLQDLPPELPPVAGILTVGTTGSLSHVALLARNLGIPHAAVSSEVTHALAKHQGRKLMVGVSSGRRVVLGWLDALSVEDGSRFKAQNKPTATVRLKIDAERLDLVATQPMLLDAITPDQSGVRVGPKAAELGRLRRLFPDRVSNAVALPFGAFVRHVRQPLKPGEISPLQRLHAAYRAAASQAPPAAEAYLLAELARFREAIATLPFPSGFQTEIREALSQIAPVGTFGVFIRSDTNVEDLKDFTGAGLNKTVANRVRFDEILAAIRTVWASPYTERSYRWRQRILENPQHVYPSVILHRTVPSESSGVMVTADLENGGAEGLTVSISEGVAAVVDGGAPQTVVVKPGGARTLIASCQAVTRKVIPPPPRQGVEIHLAEGREDLLGAAEIADLTRLAREVEAKVPPAGPNVPWDIEFGFWRGKAYLMQIRPLRTDQSAATHPFLSALDAAAQAAHGPLNLNEALP